MDVRVTTDGSKATIALAGKLTVQTSGELGSVVESLSPEICDLDIDLSAIDYVSSAGLRALAATDGHAVAHGGVMRLLHPSPDVMSVLEITGLSAVIKIEQ